MVCYDYANTEARKVKFNAKHKLEGMSDYMHGRGYFTNYNRITGLNLNYLLDLAPHGIAKYVYHLQ
jgi:hypothetical protein